MNKAALVLAFGLVLSGCETTRQTYDVKPSRVILGSKDVVWSRLIEFFATRNMPIKTIEKASGVVYAEQMVTDSGPARDDSGRIVGMADCLRYLLGVPEARVAQLNVFVKELDQKSVQATVTLNVVETYQPGTYSHPPQRCISTGLLEGQILDRLQGL